MLSSITPLGERGRNNRWWLTVTTFVAGSTIAGLLVGAALGAAGALVDRTRLVTLAIAAVGAGLALLFETRALGLRLPASRRQVNENWLQRYRGWVYGLGFGLQLGTGFLTIMTTAAVPLTFVFALLAGSAVHGAIVGGVFGAARGLMVLPAWRVRDSEGLLSLHRRIAASASGAGKATTGLMAAAAVACIVVAVA